MESRIALGVITGAHGIKGWLKLKSRMEQPEMIFTLAEQLTDRAGKPLPLRREGRVKEQFLVTLPGVKDRNAAEALRGTELFVPSSSLPAELGENEFLAADLIGMSVELRDGTAYGRVSGVFDFGAGDLLEVTPAEGKPELYGFTAANFPHLDHEARRMVLVPPEILAPGEKPPE